MELSCRMTGAGPPASAAGLSSICAMHGRKASRQRLQAPQHSHTRLNNLVIRAGGAARRGAAHGFARVAHDGERPVKRLVDRHNDKVLLEELDARRPFAHARVRLVGAQRARSLSVFAGATEVSGCLDARVSACALAQACACLRAEVETVMSSSPISFFQKKQFKKWKRRCRHRHRHGLRQPTRMRLQQRSCSPNAPRTPRRTAASPALPAGA
jgi:hypothetical protein